jgi:SOS-response transcriptional repressor LexA
MTHNSLTILEAVIAGKRKGVPPSFLDLQKATGISLNGVAYQIKMLAKLGLVAYEPGKRRTLRPTCMFIPAKELP